MHLRKNQINLTIEKLNHLVLILFKQKVKPEELVVIPLLKFFNVPVPRGNGVVLDFAELKKPDFLYQVNIKMI